MHRRSLHANASAVAVTLFLACYSGPTSDESAPPPPFGPTTTISFDVPSCMPVRIDIFDSLGRLVGTPFDTVACTLTEADLVAPVVRFDPVTGSVDTLWPGSSVLTSGIYFYRIVTPVDTVTKKMVLLK